MSIQFGYERAEALFKWLLGANTPLSSHALATRFKVSSRTIRTDIKHLNASLQSTGVLVRHKREQGYFLSAQAPEQLDTLKEQLLGMGKKNEHPLGSASERTAYLLRVLLQAEVFYSIDDLMDTLYVSKNTLYTYLKTVREQLGYHQLKLVNKTNLGFKVVGSEEDKRACMMSVLAQKGQAGYVMGFSQAECQVLHLIDTEQLNTLCDDFFNRHFPHLSDYIRKNIMLHLALSLQRIKEGYTLQHFEMDFHLKPAIQETFMAFLHTISSTFNLCLTPQETHYLLYQLAVHDVSVLEDTLEEQHQLIANFVDEVIDSIYINDGFDLRDDYVLRENLFTHIKSLARLQQIKNNRQNPLLEMIQNTFPMAYDITLVALRCSHNLLHIRFNADEVAYVALHIGAALERLQNERQSKKKAAIVCGSSTATASLLEAKILSKFNDYLKITGKYSYADYKQNIDKYTKENDFFIATVPIKTKTLPVILIDIANFEQDSEQLHQYMRSTDKETQRLLDLFDTNFMYLQTNYTDKKTLLEQVCNDLEHKGIVPGAFKALVFEREALASSVIGAQIAIPHPLRIQANTSRVALITLDKPMIWNDKNQWVQMVFLLALTQKDYPKMQVLYDFLLSVQNNKNLRDILLNCKDNKEMIELIRASFLNLLSV